jgi:hypothetical protein
VNGEILDLLDVAAKNYPIKALADEIDKAESTLRNELTAQPGYKLGLGTAYLIWSKTGDLHSLDKIEEAVGRVAFVLPKTVEGSSSVPVMKLVSGLSKQFSESIDALADALADGKINKVAAARCLQENKDLIEICIKIQAYLERLK